MPTHIHISTPFMFIAACLALGLIAIVGGLLVARGRRKSEERIELARIAALKDRPIADPSRSAPYSSFSAPRGEGWERGRTYSAEAPRSQSFSAAPSAPYQPSPAPVVMAAPAAAHGGGDALLGGMAGFMLGQAMGGHHDRVVHDTHVVHDAPSFRESAPTILSDSGFTWDSGSSSSGGSSGGCDISFGD